jgi:hypothetical protein
VNKWLDGLVGDVLIGGCIGVLVCGWMGSWVVG